MSKWKTLPNNAGNSSQKIISNKTYQVLGSTFSNNNRENAALFENADVKASTSGSTSLSFNLIDLSATTHRQFGVLLHYGGPQRYLFVGFNAEGWFWEIPNQTTPINTAAPRLNEAFKLSVNLKADGQLNVLVDEVSVLDNANIPTDVMQALQQSSAVYLTLGTTGLDRTTMGVFEKAEAIDWSKEPLQTGPAIDDAATIYDQLSNGQLSATIDTQFPRVKAYQYKGEVIFGQVKPLTSLEINQIPVTPQVTYKKLNAATAEYTLRAQDGAHQIDAELTVELALVNSGLQFTVTRIENKHQIQPGQRIDDPSLLIQQIHFPDNFLVSVASDQAQAQFAGATMSNDTHHSGDQFIRVANPMPALNEGFMYAFVSYEQLAAGVWSNSQYSHGGKTEDYTRLTAKKQTIASTNYIGIQSSPWIYQTAYQTADGTYKVNPAHTLELPQAKVVITTDRNQDGKTDWQDAAIAYREIMHTPYGAGQTPDLVGYRIAMNFGSQAQNPFLMTLDEIKKVYLNTDGLQQAVMLKGYGNEGHDSGHLNYKDIGQRMGGQEDFRYLLKEGKKLGAHIGLHVNASETYPESPYFEPNRLRKDSQGQYHYGWNWLDQAINIVSAYDLAHGRLTRFEDLKAVAGDDLNYLYVDVWGNHQSGDERAWATHQLAKEINGLGWRVAFEWGHTGEYDATFHHWAVDQPYGGYAFKGINSTIARFIRNHQKDAWVADYPQYGGAAVAPLLGGYVLNDFEGWQGRSNYQSYLDTLFAVNLPTKYLQHYVVVEVLMGESVEMSDNGERYAWTPEMRMVLTNDAGDHLEIRRLSGDPADPGYSQREIRLNGELVLLGDTYLIPWGWGEGEGEGGGEGGATERVTNKYYYYSGIARPVEADERLAGNGIKEDPVADDAATPTSSSTGNTANPTEAPTPWPLPKALIGQTLYIYELTPQGKANEQIVVPADEAATATTLNADLARNTPYVIYTQPQTQADPDLEWSSKAHLIDTGFNSGTLDHWTITGDRDAVSIAQTQGANPVLRIDAPATTTTLTQTVTGLAPNTDYVAYIAVDNRSDAQASLTINATTNSLTRSLAQNYVKADPHNTLRLNATVDDCSYFQNLFVFFTTAADPTATQLTLTRDPGTGATYWDNVRIVENHSKHFDNQHPSNKYPCTFYQDFESVPQGIFPFVIAEGEGVEDNRIHLAQKNAPYTQRGWHDKKISDVIAGDWSLKTNGLVGLNKLLYRTIPQNIAFKPGARYRVSFDYEAGLDDHYAFVIGDASSTAWQIERLKNTWQTSASFGHATYEFTAAPDGTSWIGILSTDKKVASAEASTDRDYNFKSYKDLILDNLLIERLN
ncbi:endo-alpha-N-acetylgalactosaminidase family protein [Fundicoccus culcitae]|uniref:Endo-alpha-N-acetylgalactosaminidase family protein n=1 Tax=Fundicoccus culcitae TaxID=2969821 RepID=A0ABY5PA66_9LACT|nr:endo-alpha-N-acetylgalactosaminidase family protein [Fundicoccus culcitae]UUX35295.1 endo-alpha-N-acetylgalactosaminidase family protein [Fundicoccus culcitae]